MSTSIRNEVKIRIRTYVEQHLIDAADFHWGLVPSEPRQDSKGFGYRDYTEWIPSVRGIDAAVKAKYPGANLDDMGIARASFSKKISVLADILTELIDGGSLPSG